MKTFAEKERFCETTFASGGPYWHAYTSGKSTPLLFASLTDFAFVMNIIAQTVAVVAGVKILAFEVMDNHFHFVLAAERSAVMEFWTYITRRLGRAFPLMKDMELELKPIGSLSSLRNTIVYVNRNGYVANPDHTPFSYPWGTGRHYFLDSPGGIKLSDCGFNEKREMFRCRTPQLPDEWLVLNLPTSMASPAKTSLADRQNPPKRPESTVDFVSPSSYCALRFGMAMFRDAHHYFSMLTKNVEAYSELAAELDDGEFLTDAELFTQITKIIREKYGLERLRDLTKAQKLDLARALHYDWRSSNGQIRRILGLTQYEVDSLFPLSRK